MVPVVYILLARKIGFIGTALVIVPQILIGGFGCYWFIYKSIKGSNPNFNFREKTEKRH